MDNFAAARRIVESFLIYIGIGRRVLRNRSDGVVLGMDTACDSSHSGNPIEAWGDCSGAVAEALDAIVTSISGSAIEYIYVVHLDAEWRLIDQQVHSSGDSWSAPIDCQKIIARARAVGAANLILVHNHPAGSASPSRADIVETNRIARAALSSDLRLVDHIICAPGQVRSMMRDRVVHVRPPRGDRLSVADYGRSQLRLARHIRMLPDLMSNALCPENWLIAMALYIEGRPVSVIQLSNMLDTPASLVGRRIMELAQLDIVQQRMPANLGGSVFLELTRYGIETVEGITSSAFSSSQDQVFFR